MNGWRTVKLGELGTFRNGLNFAADARGKGLPIVGVRDFKDHSFVSFDDLEQVDPSVLGTADALIRQNDILFVRSNGNRELIGRSLLVKEPPPTATSHSGFTIRFRLQDPEADPAFFAYMLRGGIVRGQLSQQGGGTNISNLNQGILAALDVAFPPLDTQRRLVTILGAYDDLIEVNWRRVALLEKMARGLFEDWFVRFRFPGHQGVPMVDTPDGLLPEGWSWGALRDFAEVSGSTANPGLTPAIEFAHFSLPAFDAGRMPIIEKGQDIKSNKLAFSSPAVLASKLNPRIPRVWYVPKKKSEHQVSSTEFVPLTPRSSHSPALIYAILGSPQFRDRLIVMAGGTSTSHQRVKPKDILDAPVAVPPTAISSAAGRCLEPLYGLAEGLREANRSLAMSRDLLLPRLMSGQLLVSAAQRELREAA